MKSVMPSFFNRSGLPQNLFQLSMNPILFCGHHLDSQPSEDSLLSISSLWLDVNQDVRNNVHQTHHKSMCLQIHQATFMCMFGQCTWKTEKLWKKLYYIGIVIFECSISTVNYCGQLFKCGWKSLHFVQCFWMVFADIQEMLMVTQRWFITRVIQC